MGISMEGLTDELLVEAVKSGDDDAFAELVRRYKRKVLRTASRFAQGGFELEDIGQDVFMKVYQNIGGYRGDAPFEHWLMRIAVRTCYDFLKSKRQEKLNIPLDSVDFSLEGPENSDSVSALQAKDTLDRAMSRLKPEDRLVITLLELEGYTIKELARLTGWSEPKVKVRAFRARKALKTILGVEDENQG